MNNSPNIVLIHGAWAEGSCWSAVIERLQADGYHVIAPQFPMTALDDDVARLRQVLDLQDGPTIVVGQRGHRKLRRDDVVTVGLQTLDDRTPTGAFGPSAVDQNNIRRVVHGDRSFRSVDYSRESSRRAASAISALVYA